MYQALKHTHMLMVALTILLFVLRGLWMMLDSPRLKDKWVRIFPHVIDTLLLITGLWMAIGYLGWPSAGQGWITAKIVALIVYIGLGTVAIKRGRTKAVRTAAFCGALLVVAYIVAVAFAKNPIPW